MSEKIFTLLFRLYPSNFRREYQGEALQFIRDRLRDETGLFRRTRLWWDLASDALIGLPSAYRNSYAFRQVASLSHNDAGIPSFKLLDREPLRRGSILVGGTVSISAFVVFTLWLSRPISYREPSGSMSPIESVLEQLNRASAPGTSTPSTSASSSETELPNGDEHQVVSTQRQNFDEHSADQRNPSQALEAFSKADQQTGLGLSTPDKPAKLSFDVASIRQSKPGTSTPPNFALDNGDSYAPFPDPGGRLIADFPLSVYIQFAYKLWLTPEQTESMLAHMPKWVAADNFEIHAKAEGNPTKDQMRLMVQSLLADRFKLAVHFETRQVPVLALVLEKPGRTGPKLLSHSDGPPCDVQMPMPAPGTSANSDGVFPPVCDSFTVVPAANHGMSLGSRNSTMKMIADSLPSVGRLGRPVVDQTGLSGRFDFTLEWTPESSGPTQTGTDAPANSEGTTFVEALKDQLGMKLKSTKAPMDVLVVDHVERPSEN